MQGQEAQSAIRSSLTAERIEARRRAQAEARARKAACDAEWAAHLHVDPDEYAAEVEQFNLTLGAEIRQALRERKRFRRMIGRRLREHRTTAVRRPRSRGAGRPGRRGGCRRTSARSGDSGDSSDGGHAQRVRGTHRRHEAGRRR
jgi:hypothetical protein